MSRVDQFREWIDSMALEPAQRSLVRNYVSDLEEIMRQAEAAPGTLEAAMARGMVAQAQLLLELYSRPSAVGRAGITAMIAEQQASCARERAAALAAVPAAEAIPWRAWVQREAPRFAWPLAAVLAVLVLARPELLIPLVDRFIGV